jgi:hypothetical protein
MTYLSKTWDQFTVVYLLFSLGLQQLKVGPFIQRKPPIQHTHTHTHLHKPEVAGRTTSTVPRTTRSRVRRFESNIEFSTVRSIDKWFLGLSIEIVWELHRETVTLSIVWKAVNDLCENKLCSSNPFTSWARSQHCEKRLLTYSCFSVCQSAWNNSAPTGGIFNKFYTWAFLENISRKFKCDSNMTRITSNLHEDLNTSVIISSWILFILRNVSDKLCIENYTLYFMFSNFLNENRAIYEIIWKNTVEADRPQIHILRRMRFLCWINWG